MTEPPFTHYYVTKVFPAKTLNGSAGTVSELKMTGKLVRLCGAALQNMKRGIRPSLRKENAKTRNLPRVERPSCRSCEKIDHLTLM